MSAYSVVRGRLAALMLLATVGTACQDPTRPDRPTPPESPPTPQPRDSAGWAALGVYQITFTGVGTDNIRATATRVDAAATGTGAASGISADLVNIPGIVFESFSSGSFTEGTRGKDAVRHVTIAYRVRNPTGGTLRNLTLVPSMLATTIPGTPWTALRKHDGSNADTSLARKIIPTGAVLIGEDMAIHSAYPDVLQVFTEAEIAAVPLPAGVTGLFPYGFMVRNRDNPASREIPPAVDANDFGGIVTFGMRIPLTTTNTDDVYTYSFYVSAFTDSVTRITESMEEAADTAATARLRARAAALGATVTTVLAGGPTRDAAVPDYPGQRTIDSVRIAGTAGAPVTFSNAPGPYSRLLFLFPGEEYSRTDARFRTGTPDEPTAGVPFTVRVKALDRYGNILKTVVDTVAIRQSAGPGDVVLPAPLALDSGQATFSVTYNSYGTGTLNAVGRRMRGAHDFDVAPVLRIWSGAVSTAWATGGNWVGGAVPMVEDSVRIPASAPRFPVLGAAVSTMGVTVENGATITMGAFDLQVGGHVATGTTGGINSTTGVLNLQGSYKTVRGIVPRSQVTGRYSLSGNLTAAAPAVIQGGSLTSSGYLLQVNGI